MSNTAKNNVAIYKCHKCGEPIAFFNDDTEKWEPIPGQNIVPHPFWDDEFYCEDCFRKAWA